MTTAPEQIRAGWRRARDEVATGRRPGPAQRVRKMDAHLTVLPVDPDTAVVDSFDQDLRDWWSAVDRTPFGTSLPWTATTCGADHLTRARREDDESWSTYVSLRRHGGIEMGTNTASVRRTLDRGRQFHGFWLLRLVGLVWLTLDLQRAAIERLHPTGPWELTLTLIDTDGAMLGNVAPGHPGPDDFRMPQAACRDPWVQIRHELEQWPQDPAAVEDLARLVGANIEDGFGSGQRRYLLPTGDDAGTIDLRRWML